MSIFTSIFDKLLEGLQVQSSVLGKFSATVVRESWKTAESKDKINTLRKALKLLENCSGKIVVSGMGRFGEVGQLVSSTISAVGTDSAFLHSSEAVHGDDLLTIQKNDLLLIISKSGNKTDLVTLASLCKAKGVPVVSICDLAKSPLGDESDLVIELGNDYTELAVGEVTPTTSIILILQICNALALALYNYNQTVGQEVVKERHPSSEFGTKDVKKVKDVMIEICPVPSSTAFEELTSILSESCREILFVEKGGEIVGQISGKDISKAVNSEKSKAKLFTKVRAIDIMNEDVRTISDDCLTADAVESMKLNKVTSLLVDSTLSGFYVVDLHSL